MVDSKGLRDAPAAELKLQPPAAGISCTSGWPGQVGGCRGGPRLFVMLWDVAAGNSGTRKRSSSMHKNNFDR
jgi:hypothetical protein